MTDHASDLHNYLRILAGTDPAGRLIEIRSGIPSGGMRQIFTPATRLELTANTIARLAARTDVYVGVLLRARRAGGRDACERSHLAFIEIDHPDAADRLAQHRCPPTMVISSGGTAGHAHAYWQLQQPVGLDELEQANRRLAIRLGGDLASVDAARILRPPTSRNWKHTPPTQVELLELHLGRRYTLTELTAGLADPSPKPRSATAPARTADQRSRPPTADHSGRRLRAGAHRAGAQPRRQNSTAPSTTTTAPVSSSTSTTGTATEPAAPAAPSTTSARSSTASARAAGTSSNSATVSPKNCCRPG